MQLQRRSGDIESNLICDIQLWSLHCPNNPEYNLAIRIHADCLRGKHLVSSDVHGHTGIICFIAVQLERCRNLLA
jgi:hypothetical protein